MQAMQEGGASAPGGSLVSCSGLPQRTAADSLCRPRRRPAVGRVGRDVRVLRGSMRGLSSVYGWINRIGWERSTRPRQETVNVNSPPLRHCRDPRNTPGSRRTGDHELLAGLPAKGVTWRYGELGLIDGQRLSEVVPVWCFRDPPRRFGVAHCEARRAEQTQGHASCKDQIVVEPARRAR